MGVPDLLVAVLWGLAWQLPWIAALIISWLLYRRRKTSVAGLVVLALGLLVAWAVAGPLVQAEAIGALLGTATPALRGGMTGDMVELLAVSGVRFLVHVVSIVLVVFLALALFRLMRDLSGQSER